MAMRDGSKGKKRWHALAKNDNDVGSTPGARAQVAPVKRTRLSSALYQTQGLHRPYFQEKKRIAQGLNESEVLEDNLVDTD